MNTFEELRNGLAGLPRAIQRFFVNDTIVALAGVSCLAGGVLIRHSTRLGDFKDGLGALCDALVIAAFLKLTVDPLLKRELTQDAAKDVFFYAFGYSLPAQLRQFVNDLLLETKVARRQCRLRWHIKPKVPNAPRLAVTLEASFFVINFSGSELQYQHKVYAWKEDSEDVGCVQSMYCRPKNHKNKAYLKETDDALTLGLDGFIRGEEIPLPAHTAEDEYEIGAVYYAEAGQPGLDQFSILEPTMEIEVSVTVDHELAHLEFSLTPDPSEKKEAENYTPVEKRTGFEHLQCSWRLDRVFVPNERVMIRWRERQIKPPTFAVLP